MGLGSGCSGILLFPDVFTWLFNVGASRPTVRAVLVDSCKM